MNLEKTGSGVGRKLHRPHQPTSANLAYGAVTGGEGFELAKEPTPNLCASLNKALVSENGDYFLGDCTA
ncbi:MAG: hypothetical protein NTV92_02675 [Candidatus Bipolaricaulota bacterium]|nr:hypothetical protein [Candidatus Bipolaricaulota bacterium]